METAVTDVVFGLDGVLVEWDGRRPITGQYPEGIAGMMFDPSDEWGMEFYLAMLGSGWSEERVLNSYEKHHGPAIAWVLKMYLEHEEDGFIGMMPGMAELLGELDKAGVRLWGLDNTTAKHVRLAQGRFSELSKFRDFRASSVGRLRLPDPLFVRGAIRDFGIDPESALFVYKDARIVKALSGMGLNAVAFKDTDNLRKSL
ncbi:hypothetical protein [Bifidobacterium sp. ESL0745]|uniref:hypothetical protein n=1 Tax=Bifidobacterium sp. ESL0745 TaxID=2983226 RepID=UPI0023F784FD|nr:hypothetical protein [Bifidobacterium sp. ESL0745]MDF7665417.1 hypothetical protein [Bifidobacterium sp. ESL0745]